MFLAFGLFILTCGATHFMEVRTLWRADFWAAAALKIVTGVASLATATALPPLIPQIGRLLQSAKLSEERLAQLEIERRERQLAQDESRSKDLFLATLSHELRTPLNAIGGWTQLLRSPNAPAQAVNKAVDAIQRNVQLQTRLVEDMLDVSAILTGRLSLKLAPVDFVALVRETVRSMKDDAERKGLTLEYQLADDAVTILDDRQRLAQVLTNLLVNAVKFPEHGRIDVSVETRGREALLTVREWGSRYRRSVPVEGLRSIHSGGSIDDAAGRTARPRPRNRAPRRRTAQGNGICQQSGGGEGSGIHRQSADCPPHLFWFGIDAFSCESLRLSLPRSRE